MFFQTIFQRQEQRLFLFIISKLNPNSSYDDYKNIIFRISIDEFARAIGIDSSYNVYREVRNVIKNLTSKIISLKQIEDGCETTTDIPMFSYAKYWHCRGYADIKISEYVASHLLELKTQFTQYKLSHIIKSTRHSETRNKCKNRYFNQLPVV